MQRLLVWPLLKLLHPKWQKKRSILKETRSKKNPPRGCRKRSWTRWGRSWWSSRCRRWDCGNLPPYCLARSPDQPWGETSKSGGWAKTWKWKWSRKVSKKVDNSQQGRDFVEAVLCRTESQSRVQPPDQFFCEIELKVKVSSRRKWSQNCIKFDVRPSVTWELNGVEKYPFNS